MKFFRLCVLVCVAAAALGCGQKGPLLLPDSPKHKRVVAPKPPAAPAPAAGGSGASASPAPAGAGTATGSGSAGTTPAGQSAPTQP